MSCELLRELLHLPVGTVLAGAAVNPDGTLTLAVYNDDLPPWRPGTPMQTATPRWVERNAPGADGCREPVFAGWGL